MAINLAQLRAFVAVVDEGSFGAAADSLGVTQSAVSHTLAAFERAVGRPVVRRADGRPTSFGERLLPDSRAAVAATAAIGELAADGAGEPRGTLRLGAPSTVCHGLIPDLLHRWADDYPGIRVLLFEGQDDDVAEWLKVGTVDLAVLVNPNPSDGLVIGEDAFHALLRDDHPLAHETVVNVRDLADDPLLFCLGGCEPQVREVYRLAGTTPVPTHRMRELGTMIGMVRAGIGVAVVPGLTQAMLGPHLVLVPLHQRVTRRLVLTGPAERPWHRAAAALLGRISRTTTPNPPTAPRGRRPGGHPTMEARAETPTPYEVRTGGGLDQ